MLIKFKKAQSTAEYAILFSLVVGAALAMQVYIRRSIQLKMYSAGIALTNIDGDALSGEGEGPSGYTLGTETQYEPYYKVQGISGNSRDTFLDRSTVTTLGGYIEDKSKQTAAIGSGSVETSHVVDLEETVLSAVDYDDPGTIEIPIFKKPPTIEDPSSSD